MDAQQFNKEEQYQIATAIAQSIQDEQKRLESIAQSIKDKQKRAELAQVAGNSHNVIKKQLDGNLFVKAEKDIKPADNGVVADDKYSEMTQVYLKNIQDRQPSLATMLAEMQLTLEEEEKLIKFQDPVQLTIVTTPVRFNGQLYNLQTLLDCLGKHDPLTNQFIVRKEHITPDWDTLSGLEEALKAIKVERTKADDVLKSKAVVAKPEDVLAKNGDEPPKSEDNAIKSNAPNMNMDANDEADEYNAGITPCSIM